MNSIIRNEFAMVEVSVNKTPSGATLRVRDLGSGSEIMLDALELEAVTRISHWQFESFVDPSWMVPQVEPDPDQV